MFQLPQFSPLIIRAGSKPHRPNRAGMPTCPTPQHFCWFTIIFMVEQDAAKRPPPILQKFRASLLGTKCLPFQQRNRASFRNASSITGLPEVSSWSSGHSRQEYGSPHHSQTFGRSGCLDRIAHEHGDRHRPHPTGHRGNSATLGGYLLIGHVPNKPVASFSG